MKKYYSIFALLFLALFTKDINAQCIPANTRPVFGTVTGSTGTQTFNNMPTGNVVQITPPAAGTFYTISMCQTNGGVAQADGDDDSQLTVLDLNSSAATNLAFNDDFCPTTGPNGFGPSEVTYTATGTGSVFVYLTEWDASGNDCVADGTNTSYTMTVTITSMPPPCSAGVINTTGFPLSNCPGDTFVISTDGSETTPTDYAVFFSPQAGASGANGSAFSLTGVSFPYVGDEDLNGVLSGQTTPLPPLSGTWAMYTVARNTGVACDQSTDSVLVTFLSANDPACSSSATYDVTIDSTFLSEYTSIPSDQVEPLTAVARVANIGLNTVTNVSVAVDIRRSGTSVYSNTMTQASLSSGASTVLTASSSYTPDSVGFYLTEYIVSISEADGDLTNDTLYSAIIVSDSTYSRDFTSLTNNVDGAFGIGSGDRGFIGNVFEVLNPTTSHSIEFFSNNSLSIGDTIRGVLYNMAAGLPNNRIDSTALFIVSQADTPVTRLELLFTELPLLSSGDYYVAVEEYYGYNSGILYSNLIYTPGKTLIELNGSFLEPGPLGFPYTPLVRTKLYSNLLCDITGYSYGTQTACDPATNTFTQEVTVTYTNPPSSGMLSVHDQNFAITSSPQTVTLTGLYADGLSTDFSASFTANSSCILVGPGYTAPAFCSCAFTDIVAGNQTACDPATNEYTQELTLYFLNAPTTGTIDVNGQNFAIGTSPQTITLTGLIADGNPKPVNASFTANASCVFEQNSVYTAPANCTPLCSISDIVAGTQTACVSSTNEYTQEVTVIYSGAPATGTLDVNGQSFAIGTSPQAVVLTGLVSDGNPVNVTASFSAEPNCSTTSSNLFTAPANCLCPTINVTVTSSDVTNCATPDGSATAVASGGAGNYSYSWTPSSFGSGATISNIPSGTYTVLATDANGCTGSASGNVNNTSGVNALVGSISMVDCFNGNNGAISINTSGGTGTISYTWSDQPGVATSISSKNNLTAGNYTVVVEDGGGCSVTLGPIEITEPDELIVVVDNSTDVSCNGANDGAINVSVTGGNGNNTYSWSNGGGSNEDAAGLGQGNYVLTVTDMGCPPTTSAAVTIDEPSAIAISIDNSSDISCIGSNDGSIIASVTGGTGAYTILWNNGAGSSLNPSNLGPNSYQLTITDDNNCSEVSNVVTISEPSAISVNSSSIPASTNNNDGSASVQVSGGTSPYNYAWNDANAQTSSTANNLMAGTYICTITDANNCATTETIVVTMANAIDNLSVQNVLIFPNPSNGLITVQFETEMNQDFEIELYNTIGKQVYSNSYQDVNGVFIENYDFGKLSSGLYYMKISTANTELIKKLTISK